MVVAATSTCLDSINACQQWGRVLAACEPIEGLLGAVDGWFMLSDCCRVVGDADWLNGLLLSHSYDYVYRMAPLKGAPRTEPTWAPRAEKLEMTIPEDI